MLVHFPVFFGNPHCTVPASERSTFCIAFSASADGRHFYAYTDGDMAAHGHASEWDPGYAGLFVEGDGVIRIRMLHLVLLRENTEGHAEEE